MIEIHRIACKKDSYSNEIEEFVIQTWFFEIQLQSLPAFSPLTESCADVDAVPALKVTVQQSLTCNSFSRSRWRRPLSNDTISTVRDSFTGLPSRNQWQSLLSGRDRAHSNSVSPPSKVSAFSRPWTIVIGLPVEDNRKMKRERAHSKKTFRQLQC